MPAWTFDGQLPEPQLTVNQGELVEVRLRSADIAEGVTLHWHGYSVPSGEDGAARRRVHLPLPSRRARHVLVPLTPGVQPGRPDGPVRGAGRTPPQPAAGLDLAVPVHTIGGATLFGAVDGLDRRAVAPGTPVRLRLVNTDDTPRVFALRGAPFQLAAVDGRDLTGPGVLDGDRLLLSAGGRYDLGFVMPATPVHLAADGRADRGLLLSADAAGQPPAAAPDGPLLDITRYAQPSGEPAPTHFDRDFTLVLDRQARFLDGVPTYAHTVNGAVYPNIATQLVREGEWVKMTVVNRGAESHPMHPHGHHVLVLARNGVPAAGGW